VLNQFREHVVFQTGRERLDPAQSVGAREQVGVILPMNASAPAMEAWAVATSSALTHSAERAAARRAEKRSSSTQG